MLRLLLGLVVLVIAGCGGSGDFEVMPVRGTVMCNGKPVSGGSITFSPVGETAKAGMSGKAAASAVGTDGSFVLSTYDEQDGAIIGRHRVVYSPADPYEPSVCGPPKNAEVEVVSGSNDFTIELEPKS